MKRSVMFKKIFVILVPTFAIAITFQNCAPYRAQELSSSQVLQNVNPNIASACALADGSKVLVGGTVKGYPTASVLYPLTCGNEVTRVCLGTGLFDGSMPLSSQCQQQCLHPDSSQAVNSGAMYVYFTKSTGVTQADCDAAKVTSTCQASSGTFQPTPPTQRFATCLVQGQTCAYTAFAGTSIPTGNAAGSTVIGYALSSATYPTLCGAQVTRVCQATGSWGGSIPLYQACIQKCVHPDNSQPVDQNMTYTYYSIAQGTADQCAAAKVVSTCQAATGLFSPIPSAARYATCAVIAPPTISQFTATPASVPAGTMANLKWVATGASTLVLNPGAIDVTANTAYDVAPSATTVYTLTATNPVASTSATVTVNVTAALMGEPLYAQSCASCHIAFASSNLKGRVVTAAKITGAMDTISSMAGLKGMLTTEQVNSLAQLFTSTGGTGASSFACASAAAQNLNSVSLLRLTGYELQNTYQSVLPTAVWTGLAGSLYLIPRDIFGDDLSTFKNTYSDTAIEQLSRFHEEAANQIVSSATNIKAFFGSCATSTSFAKTCFDSFLTTSGPKIFRSALASDDSARIWAVVLQGASVPDQMKIAVQMMLNDPRFMYHIEVGEGVADANGLYALSSYEIANRLAYGMTSAPPDATLWAAAVANSLKTTAAVAAQVDRIALTDSFQNRVVEMMKFYIGKPVPAGPTSNVEFLNGISSAGLDTAVTDEFSDFVKYIVFTQKGTLLDLFTSSAAFPRTSALASVMGTAMYTSGAPLQAPNRVGLISRPYFVFAGTPTLKLVQRGRALRLNMLCSEVPQPSASDIAGRMAMTDQDLIALNRRDYVNKATLQAPACILCHSKMNQMGFITEPFDSIGRFTTTERIYNSSEVKVAQFPVIASATPRIVETDDRTFANLTEFATAFSQSDAAQQCFSRKAFQFMLRTVDNLSYDSCRLNSMDTKLKQNGPLLDFFTQTFKSPSLLYKRSN